MANFDKMLEQAKPHLNPGEEVLAHVFGAYETKIFGKDSVRNGVLIATGNRIVFFAKKLGGYDIESFDYRHVSSFEQSKNMLGHTVQFFASGNKVSVKWIADKEAMAAFVALVREKLSTPAAPAAPAAPVDDVYDQLRKLGELRDAGILTPEEFDAKKAALLATM